LLALAAVALPACSPSNDAAGTEVAVIASFPPQTPKTDMDHSSSTCRIRDEIPVDNVTTLRLPEIDTQVLQEQDQNPLKDNPLRYAIPVEVNIDPSAYGRWEKADQEIQIWRLKLISPQALSLSLGFSAYNMPEGGCLFVYSLDQGQILGPYTKADNADHGQLWTPTIDREEVIIEISVPNDQVSQMQLVLGSVNHGYKK
jgi:lysyl endopeptidase